MSKQNGMVKDWITMRLTKKFGYFYDMRHFKIITKTVIDNIMSEHMQISCNS